MGLLLCALAFVGSYSATRWSLGKGLGVVLAVGYFYGILRARNLDGISHFMFDLALLGLYLAYFSRKPGLEARSRGSRAVRWFGVLALWPVVAMGLSAFTGGQHIFVQLVGLRSAVLVLPLFIIGARLEAAEFRELVLWIVVLNVIALGFACAELMLGVDRFFPENEVTQLIFRSNDVGEGGLRIPSTFNTAHAYGGTMLLSLPFLISLIAEKKGGRILGMLAMCASVVGIFISAARTPVVQLGLVLGLVILFGRLPLKAILPVLFVSLGAALVIANDSRFQRFSTLSDQEMVQTRLGGSMNNNFVEVVSEHPLGKGLASAVGTSIPFFLQSYAEPQIGLENEYSHIAVEQGILGLLLWLALLATLMLNIPKGKKSKLGLLPERTMWALVSVVWMTAFAGTGVLSSVPGSFLLSLQMGVLLTAAPQLVTAPWAPRQSVAA